VNVTGDAIALGLDGEAPGDVAAIRETLKSLAGWHKTGALAGRFAARNLEALNFASLTGRLADLLNEVAFSPKRV